MTKENETIHHLICRICGIPYIEEEDRELQKQKEKEVEK